MAGWILAVQRLWNCVWQGEGCCLAPPNPYPRWLLVRLPCGLFETWPLPCSSRIAVVRVRREVSQWAQRRDGD